MIKTYQSKPVRIQAFQWFPGGEILFKDCDVRESFFIDGAFILSPEGQHVIRPGYWIVKGTKGEYYGVHPEVFAEKYEEAK